MYFYLEFSSSLIKCSFQYSLYRLTSMFPLILHVVFFLCVLLFCYCCCNGVAPAPSAFYLAFSIRNNIAVLLSHLLLLLLLLLYHIVYSSSVCTYFYIFHLLLVSCYFTNSFCSSFCHWCCVTDSTLSLLKDLLILLLQLSCKYSSSTY